MGHATSQADKIMSAGNYERYVGVEIDIDVENLDFALNHGRAALDAAREIRRSLLHDSEATDEETAGYYLEIYPNCEESVDAYRVVEWHKNGDKIVKTNPMQLLPWMKDFVQFSASEEVLKSPLIVANHLVWLCYRESERN